MNEIKILAALVAAALIIYTLAGCAPIRKQKYKATRTGDTVTMTVAGRGVYKVKTEKYKAKVDNRQPTLLEEIKDLLMLKWLETK